MALGRGLKPFMEPEGLFARKSSTNILSDPRILEHLRIVAEEAQFEEIDEENLSDDDELEYQRKELEDKITAYNKRNQFGAFRVTQNELNYKGAVRFYFEAGKQELTKAVEITNKTKVEDLLPLLVDKFNLTQVDCHYTLYVVHEVDEIALDDSDCPLTIAINALKVPRFVLRRKQLQIDEINERNLRKQTSRTSSASGHSADQANTDHVVFTPRSNLKSTASSGSSSSKGTSDKNVNISSHVTEINTPTSRSLHKSSNKTKRTKSFSQIASMVRKKKGVEKSESAELSTYRLAPGILKVFGDHVSPGSNYKSVRASTISTAREVVKQALEKYSIENANPSDYVLCDVVGHFKVENSSKAGQEHEEAQWVTEYMRVVNDNEKPLVVQSLWIPATGRLRRFELIKKMQMEAGCFFINTADNIRRDSNLSSPNLDSERSSIVSDHVIGEQTLMDSSLPNTPRNATYATEEQSFAVSLRAPFLLLVKGCDVSMDKLINPLIKPMITVGNPKSARPSSKPDISLFAVDIASEHCYIHKKISLEKGAHETNIDDICFTIFIEPAPKASVFVNGVKIEQLTMLQPGQLVSLGSEYCFMFKDPTQIDEKNLKLSWLDALKQGKQRIDQSQVTKRDQSVQVDLDARETVTVLDEVDSAPSLEDNLLTKERAGSLVRSAVMLTYKYENEDELLDKVIHNFDEKSLEFKLTPAYLLTMMIEHCCATFNESHARKLLLKISSALQSVAWEKTKDIGKHSTDKKDDVGLFFDAMLLDLAPVVKWMANALEMLHYFQCNLNKYLRNASPSKLRDSLVSADEELLTVLEEVIMFTFQQTVYHLTKVLYSTLPAILDTNPFQSEDVDDDDDEETVSTPPGVKLIIDIFGKTLSLVSSHNVHPQIITQLFDYLFFFTNASLFNSLMERGAGGKFYRWTKGVQIRGNLDVLEEFASRSGLQDHFSDHMKKVVAAVALLSIPKAQLMSMDWNTIRDDYLDLNASQVQQLLGEYQLGGKGRPRGWYPPPEEVEAALRSSDVLESFATHPPLLLPTTDFIMDLNNLPKEEEFSTLLTEIEQSYAEQNARTTFPKQTPDKRLAMRTSNGPSQENDHKSVSNYLVSIQPNMTSTPQKDDVAAGMKMVRASRTPSNSSTRSDTRNPQSLAPKGNGNGSDTSEILEGTPELAAKWEDTHRYPTPVPDKRHNIVVEHDIDLGENDQSSDEETRAAVLGHPQLIQTAPRKGSADGRVSKSSIIYAESTAKSNGESRIDSTNNNQPQIYVKKLVGDEDIADVDFTSNDVDFTTNSVSIDGPDDVIVVDLLRGDKGLGLGLIDGLITPLESPGIYIRTIVSNSPAAKDGRIKLGDRILAVNGNSLVGSDYSRAMDMIIHAGTKLSFLIAKSDKMTIEKILSSQC